MARVTRPCTICTHPARVDIDRAMLSGDSVRAIGTRFGTAKSSVNRHRSHIAATPVNGQKALVAGQVGHVSLPPMVEQRRRLDVEAMVWRILDEAERLGAAAELAEDYRTAMAKLGHLRGVLELVVGKRPTELIEKPGAWAELSPGERMKKIAETERKLAELKAKTAAELANGDVVETNPLEVHRETR